MHVSYRCATYLPTQWTKKMEKKKKKRIKILVLKMTGKFKKNGITGKLEVKSWKVKSER